MSELKQRQVARLGGVVFEVTSSVWDVSTTGDGIVSALQALYAMVSCGSSLYELRNKMVKFPQTMINVRIKDKKDLQGVPAIADAVAAVEAVLGRKGRVLLRPSGTEPVVRVMVEGEDAALVQRLAEELASQVRQHA